MAVRSIGHEEVPSLLPYELGHEYLYVRGDCRYWVADVSESNLRTWKVSYTGVLTEATEEQLSRELLFERWDELDGLYLGPGNPGGYEVQYFDGVSLIRCELGCSSDVDAPQVLKDLSQVGREWILRLQHEGTPMNLTDPMRVDILQVTSPKLVSDEPCALEWPFTLDPKTVSRLVDEPLGRSVLVSDAEVSTQMRALRDQYLAGKEPPGTCNLPLMDSQFFFYEAGAPNVAFSVWMRDHIPLEPPEGGVLFPEAP